MARTHHVAQPLPTIEELRQQRAQYRQQLAAEASADADTQVPPSAAMKRARTGDPDINRNCWLTNTTSEPLSNWGVYVQIRLSDNSWTSWPLDADPGQTTAVELREKCNDKSVTSWRLTSHIHGLIFWPEETNEVEVQPGGRYELVLDKEQPPLTLIQLNGITKELLLCAEEGVWDLTSCWSRVLEKFFPGSARTAESLQAAYESQDCGATPHPSWRQLYNPVGVRQDLSKEQLCSALQSEKELTFHIYWRALDRDPGGNTDELTMRYRVHFTGEHTTKAEISCVVFYDYDNTCTVTGPYTPTTASTKISSAGSDKVRSELIALCLKLLAKGLRDSEFHVVEGSHISQEKWSSVEVLVFLEGERLPVLRLHQSSVDSSSTSDEPEQLLSPCEEQESAIQYVSSLVGQELVSQVVQGYHFDGTDLEQSVAGTDYTSAEPGDEIEYNYSTPHYFKFLKDQE